jgi:hypothetical protein
MWIALNDGFISIVTADRKRLPKAEKKLLKGKGRPLCVRARKAEHLARLFPGKKLYEFRNRDYPARVFIGADELAPLIAERVLAIDYDNFKSSVRDRPLHDAYMGVWGVMHSYQHGRYDPKPYYGPQQSSFAYDRGGGPWGPSEDDWKRNADRDEEDGVCGLLGCTTEQPCMDCIIDALRDQEDGVPDDEMPETSREWFAGATLRQAKERYGDFDDRDDTDAKSHLRVPPK